MSQAGGEAEPTRDNLDRDTSNRDSVSIAFVRQALAGLKRRGGDPAKVLQIAGVPESLLRSEQSRVSARSFGDLWLAIGAELDDELFGLDSRRMKVGSFALLCHATAQAPTLRQALGLAVRFFNVIMDDARLSLGSDNGHACIVIEECSDRPSSYAVFAHETLLVMLHGLICWLAGRRIALREARLAYPQPDWWPEYCAMFSSNLQFGAAHTAVSFDAKVLAIPINRPVADVRRFLREAPHNFIVKFRDRNSCAARVRRRLRGTSPQEWPAITEIAAELGLAVSTLHRKLKQEGVAFSDIRDGLRRDLAIEQLTHTDASVAQIAVDLGFAEPSAFHRAFKLWTGLQPGAYRRERLPQDSGSSLV